MTGASAAVPGTDWDVICVGGGIAGLIAANRAVQLGRRALVLEQGDDERYPCNSRYTGGAFHVAYREVTTLPAELTAAIERTGLPGTPVARAVADEILRAVRWLQREGIRFIKGPEEYQRWLLAPPRSNKPGLHWRNRSGDTALRTLEDALNRRGSAVLRNASVRSLQMAEGVCRGVEVEIDGKAQAFNAQAVILADGGFQGAPDLLRRSISPAPEKLVQRGAGTGVGTGIRMAEAAGAALSLDAFYGHVVSRDALHNDNLWPWPLFDNIAASSIVVGPDGRRFADESKGGVFLANAIAALPDPLSAMAIFDDRVWEGPGREKFIPANPHLADLGATMHRASGLDELAALAGLPADALAETVENWNSAVTEGTAQNLSPPGSTAAKPLSPPYRAAPLAAGITYTMGGIEIDGDARVVRPDRSPIPGLYAAGTTAAGFEGGPDCIYIGGLAQSAVTALRAAEALFREQTA